MLQGGLLEGVALLGRHVAAEVAHGTIRAHATLDFGPLYIGGGASLQLFNFIQRGVLGE